MDKGRKMEGDYHEQRRTTWFLGKEGVKLSDIDRLLSEIRGGKAPASSTVFNWLRSLKSGKETAQKGVNTSLPTTYLPPATQNQIQVNPGGETHNIW